MLDDSLSGMNKPRGKRFHHRARWLSYGTQGACAWCSFFPYQRQVDAILGSHYLEAGLDLPIRISDPSGGYYHTSSIQRGQHHVCLTVLGQGGLGTFWVQV